MSEFETIGVALRSLAAMAMAGAFAVVAYALAVRLIREGTALLRLCAAIVLGMWVPTILFHFLIGFGQFRLPTALATLGCLLAVTLRWITPVDVLGRQWASDLASFHEARNQLLSTGWRRAAFGVLLILALHALLRALLLPPLGGDALTYHGVKAAMWVQHGNPDVLRAPGGSGSMLLLPGGSEVFHAWILLPLRSDLLAGAVDFVCWLALGLLIIQFCRELGFPTAAGLVGALYVLFLPLLRLQIGTGYGELPLMCGVMGGLLFSVHFFRSRNPSAVLLAMMAFGVTAGIKTHVWPALAWSVVVIGVLAFLTTLRDGANKSRRAFLLGCLCAGLAVLPWFWMNLRAGFLPLSPFPIQIGNLLLGEPTPSFIMYHGRPDATPPGLIFELGILFIIFQQPFANWPHSGVFTLLVAAAGLAFLPNWRRQGASNTLFLAGFIVIGIAVFYSPSFLVIRRFWTYTAGRFLLPAAVPAFLLGLNWLWLHPQARRPLVGGLMAATLIHGAVAVFRGVADFEWRAISEMAVVLAALVGILYVVSRLSRRAWIAGVTGTVLLCAALAGLQKERDAVRHEAFQGSTMLEYIVRTWVPGTEVLDDPAVPRRLACTAGVAPDGNNWFLYGFLGRRFQNELTYVSPTRSGRILDATSWKQLAAESDAETWFRRLAESGVSHVVSLPPWTMELVWMKKNPALFTKVAGDDRSWGVYRMNHP